VCISVHLNTEQKNLKSESIIWEGHMLGHMGFCIAEVEYLYLNIYIYIYRLHDDSHSCYKSKVVT